ncbi:MAG: alpha/beta hydrolase [Actinobacteria bacterium]|nr:alpha/beta hydrolase [Actinomycetota bacterium]MBV9665300.1 alpha/beta hydrolase [Actinomycetota bacterium]MBV9933814.1 alpha/beta hydrolase [Actinomycetota bacterium]
MASDELVSVIEILRAQPVADGVTVEEMRSGMEALIGNAPLPEGASIEDVDVDGVPGAWVTADGAADDKVVLYLHGGGYAIGSIKTHRALAANISKAVGVRVLLIDYRLAPEHPHPAAVDDAVTAWKWLLAQGLAPANMAISGDSAGGGLTFATLLALRDQGLPLPACAVPISPWVEMEAISDSHTTRAEVDPMVHSDGLKRMADWYLNGIDVKTPLAAPLHADLRGLPPIFVQVGDAEVLLDDATRIVEKAKAAGVDATCEVIPDGIHVLHAFAPLVPEANDAIDRLAAFMRQHLPS